MMKREDVERLLLLEDSGEISEAERRVLQAALEAGTDIAALRARQEALVAEARGALAVERPHPSTRVRIREAAEARAAGRGFGVLAPRTIRGLAFATVCVLLFFGMSVLSKDSRSGRILEINGLMVAAGSDEDATIDADVDLDLQTLGRQLLEMQGLAMDESELFEDAPPSSDGGLPPTASQENRNFASLPRIYG